jgi:hypothetical protein
VEGKDVSDLQHFKDVPPGSPFDNLGLCTWSALGEGEKQDTNWKLIFRYPSN